MDRTRSRRPPRRQRWLDRGGGRVATSPAKPPKWCVKAHPHRGRHTPDPAKATGAPTPFLKSEVLEPPAAAPPPPALVEHVVEGEEAERTVRDIARDELARARMHVLKDLGATVLDGRLVIDHVDGRYTRARVGDHDVAGLVAARHQSGQHVRLVLISIAVEPAGGS